MIGHSITKGSLGNISKKNEQFPDLTLVVSFFSLRFLGQSTYVHFYSIVVKISELDRESK